MKIYEIDSNSAQSIECTNLKSLNTGYICYLLAWQIMLKEAIVLIWSMWLVNNPTVR